MATTAIETGYLERMTRFRTQAHERGQARLVGWYDWHLEQHVNPYAAPSQSAITIAPSNAIEALLAPGEVVDFNDDWERAAEWAKGHEDARRENS